MEPERCSITTLDIKALRKEARLSQKELATQLKISVKSLAKYEKKPEQLPFNLLFKLLVSLKKETLIMETLL